VKWLDEIRRRAKLNQVGSGAYADKAPIRFLLFEIDRLEAINDEINAGAQVRKERIEELESQLAESEATVDALVQEQ